jgi:hypothetical protein
MSCLAYVALAPLIALGPLCQTGGTENIHNGQTGEHDGFNVTIVYQKQCMSYRKAEAGEWRVYLP